MMEQPPCFFFGASVRNPEPAPVARHETAHLQTVEAALERAAVDPEFASGVAQIRDNDQALLLEHWLISQGEYAVQAVGICLGDRLNEGEYLVGDPSQPIRSGDLAMIRVRGDTTIRGKIFLGRMDEIANEDQVFCEKPRGICIFWSPNPATLHGVAWNDMLAADLCVARLGGNPGQRHSLPEMLTDDDHARLEGTLSMLDRRPLDISGESAFEVDQRMLLAPTSSGISAQLQP